MALSPHYGPGHGTRHPSAGTGGDARCGDAGAFLARDHVCQGVNGWRLRRSPAVLSHDALPVVSHGATSLAPLVVDAGRGGWRSDPDCVWTCPRCGAVV